MASLLDRGDSYTVGYLGSAMLTQMATGLGVLQKPLKELYFRYRQAGGGTTKWAQERQLIMSHKGLTVLFKEKPNAPAQETFYAMPHIVFWDAVQFVTVKGQDKKSLKGAFEAVDNNFSRNKDNLFAPLDKKYHFLQQLNHPPVFACVLRRTAGVKALDVHAFVCSTDEEAVNLVRTLYGIQKMYKTDEVQETGVFAYRPYGTARPGTGSSTPSSGNSPAGSLEKTPSISSQRSQMPAASPRSDRSPSPPLSRTPSMHQTAITPHKSPQVSRRPGTFMLTQDDFQVAQSPADSSPVDAATDGRQHHGHQYYQNISAERYTSGPGEPDTAPYVASNVGIPTRFDLPRGASKHGSRGDDISRIKEGSSPSTANAHTPIQQRDGAKLGQGFSLLSGSGSVLPGQEERSYRERYPSSPPEVRPRYTAGGRSRSPSYQSELPNESDSLPRPQRDRVPPQSLHLESQSRESQFQQRRSQYGGGNYQSPASRGQTPQSHRSPPGINDRSSAPSQPSFRYLPGTRSEQPPPSVPPRSSEVVDSRIRSPSGPPSRRSPSPEPPPRDRPVAMVSPHKIQGVKVLPTMPSAMQQRKPGSSVVSPTGSAGRPKSNYYEDDDPYGFSAQPPRRSKSQYFEENQYYSTPPLADQYRDNWQLGPVGAADYTKPDVSDNGGERRMNEKLLLSKKKDAEIASVMQNLRFDDTQARHIGARTNFEKSLGYFP